MKLFKKFAENSSGSLYVIITRDNDKVNVYAYEKFFFIIYDAFSSIVHVKQRPAIRLPFFLKVLTKKNNFISFKKLRV